MEHKIVMDPADIPAELEKLAALQSSERHLASLLSVTPYGWFLNDEDSGAQDVNFPYSPEYQYAVVDPVTGSAIGIIVEGHYQGLLPRIFSVYEVRPDLRSVAAFDALSRRN
jgi:hypothetical protein